MFKKILLASAIVVSTVGVASASSSAPYVGAGIGITTNTTSNTGQKGGPAGNYRGVPFNLFAGYGAMMNQSFYLAGELEGTVANAEITDNGPMKTSYGYGASVVPGVMLSDHTMAFARAGIVRTRFSNVNSSATGGKFGLGMQTSLTQNVDLRGEYDYTAYKTVSSLSSPRTDSFNLGIVYKFD